MVGVSNQLEMAIINLVVNAIHAMGDKGGGRLSVRSARRGDEVEISVSDTGPGIPEHIRHYLFEPFVTTKTEGRGTGLGLSTVLMIVERHRGRIDFASSPGGHDLPHQPARLGLRAERRPPATGRGSQATLRPDAVTTCPAVAQALPLLHWPGR